MHEPRLFILAEEHDSLRSLLARAIEAGAEGLACAAACRNFQELLPLMARFPRAAAVFTSAQGGAPGWLPFCEAARGQNRAFVALHMPGQAAAPSLPFACERLPKPNPASPSFRADARRAALAAARMPSTPDRRLERPAQPIAAGSAYCGKVVLVGSSTGGTEALADIFRRLRPGLPPILIAQHMPEHFTRSFAARLSAMGPVRAAEAEHGEPLEPGRAYLAPGGFHLRLVKSAGALRASLGSDPKINLHRPSVEALFDSAAFWAPNCLCAMLTGMGRDGACAMARLKAAGCPRTVAQNEKSCVVYGMPKACADLGCADAMADPEGIAAEICKFG